MNAEEDHLAKAAATVGELPHPPLVAFVAVHSTARWLSAGGWWIRGVNHDRWPTKSLKFLFTFITDIYSSTFWDWSMARPKFMGFGILNSTRVSGFTPLMKLHRATSSETCCNGAESSINIRLYSRMDRSFFNAKNCSYENPDWSEQNCQRSILRSSSHNSIDCFRFSHQYHNRAPPSKLMTAAPPSRHCWSDEIRSIFPPWGSIRRD